MVENRNEWAINRRLLFIERRLAKKGRINRADLVAEFGISERQASSDLGAYIAVAPDNLRYDLEAKAYMRGNGFRAVLGGQQPERRNQ